MGILGSLVCIVGCIIVTIINFKFIFCNLIEDKRLSPFKDFRLCDPPLWIRNGIGFTLYRGGRKDMIYSKCGDYTKTSISYSYYLFFCILLPIFPIGCYRASEVNLPRRWGQGQSYRIYGREKWKFWEVVYIYINVLAGVAVFCCILNIFLLLID